MRHLVLATLVLCLSAGCVAPTSPKASPPSSPKPAKPASYESVNFKKLINPAFSSSYFGKGVQFRCLFGAQRNMVLDLPEEFHKGYVRCTVYADSSFAEFTSDLLVPKDKSDVVFASTAQKSIWDIKAQVLGGSTTSAVSGGSQSQIFLITDQITPVTE